MNTVIVPTDFSEASLNAARYAVKLITGLDGVEMILYHTYENNLEVENIYENLERIKGELQAGNDIKISTLADEGDFVTELDKLARHLQADLIVMGIGDRPVMAQAIMGNNTLKMTETKFCPILVIHPDCEFREIKNVLLATDLKNVISTTPSGPIKKILRTFHPNLHVINVNTEHYVALTEEHEAERQSLKEMFSEFNPEFYFLRLYDVDEAINQFASDKNIDLIIAIHKEHSAVYRFFKTSHIKNLAYQSTVPLLTIHE